MAAKDHGRHQGHGHDVRNNIYKHAGVEETEKTIAEPDLEVNNIQYLTIWDRFTCKPVCSPCCHTTVEKKAEPVDTPNYVNDERCGIPAGGQPRTPRDATRGELVEKPAVEIEAGAKYQGQWCGTQCHGYGRLHRSDGSWYEGYFVSGRAHGQGKFSATNGNIYEGQWDQDRAHGYGRYTFIDGSSYEGDWYRDEKCGEGKEKWADGSIYMGQFYHGAKHGTGTYTSTAGVVVYQGQFKDDRMDGEGIYSFANGRTFEGTWEMGHMHGQGTMKWLDGSVYSGQFVKDLRHGDGRLTWADGREYTGHWERGKQEGQGTIRDSADGVVTHGSWRSGVLMQE